MQDFEVGDLVERDSDGAVLIYGGTVPGHKTPLFVAMEDMQIVYEEHQVDTRTDSVIVQALKRALMTSEEAIQVPASFGLRLPLEEELLHIFRHSQKGALADTFNKSSQSCRDSFYWFQTVDKKMGVMDFKSGARFIFSDKDHHIFRANVRAVL